MTTMKRIKKVTKLNPSDYVNPETGETISSELQSEGAAKVTLIKEEDTDFYIIESKEYLVIDSKALFEVAKVISEAELAKIFKMADYVQTPFNILYEKPYTPHTSESLAEHLEYNLNNFYSTIRKLVKKGILAYIVCAPSGYLRKVYMLNPTLVRKGKKYHNYIKDIFPDLTKGIPEEVKKPKKIVKKDS